MFIINLLFLTVVLLRGPEVAMVKGDLRDEMDRRCANKTHLSSSMGQKFVPSEQNILILNFLIFVIHLGDVLLSVSVPLLLRLPVRQ